MSSYRTCHSPDDSPSEDEYEEFHVRRELESLCEEEAYQTAYSIYQGEEFTNVKRRRCHANDFQTFLLAVVVGLAAILVVLVFLDPLKTNKGRRIMAFEHGLRKTLSAIELPPRKRLATTTLSHWLHKSPEEPLVLVLYSSTSKGSHLFSSIRTHATVSLGALPSFKVTASTTRMDLHKYFTKVSEQPFRLAVLENISDLRDDSPLALHGWFDDQYVIGNGFYVLIYIHGSEDFSKSCEEDVVKYISKRWEANIYKNVTVDAILHSRIDHYLCI